MPAPVTKWKQLKIQVPGADLLKQLRAILETLLIFLEILKTLLETIKLFLIDFGNPIKILVEALLKLILTFLEALKRTGLYAYWDVPEFTADLCMRRHVGGWREFLRRWKGSFYDAKDGNRPQPLKNALKGGFILIVAEADATGDFLRAIKILLKLFSKDMSKPYYPPPANVRAVPVGDKGDPILSVTKIFKRNVGAIAIEWSLPTTTGVPDPYFENLITQFSTEFYPPKFLIERSSKPLNMEVTSDQLATAGTAGYATHQATTQFEINGAPGKVQKRKIRLADEHGEQFLKFETYQIVSAADTPITFLLGQLSTFRWIDTKVNYDQMYYYRVRAFSGSLFVRPDGSIPFYTQVRNFSMPDVDGTNIMVVWPTDTAKPNDEPVMGRASAVVKCRIHKMPENFDLIEAMSNIFLVALSFDFQLEAPEGAQFDQAGNPVPPTQASAIGVGLLNGKTSIFANPFYQLAGEIKDNRYAPDPVTAQYPKMPWQIRNIRAQAHRLVYKIASAMLEQGTSVAKQFQTYMQGLWPAGAAPGVPIHKVGSGSENVTTLEQMCAALTEITYDKSGGTEVTDAMVRNGYVPLPTVQAFSAAYYDANSRKNVVTVVNFLLALAYGGVEPNWGSVSLLRDIFPWTAGLLYMLLDAIQALLDAFKGILDEIKAFINLIIRKIDVLERLIKFLISILNYLEALAAVSFNMISATGLSGNVDEWFAAVDNAQGNPPKSGPTGYCGGICLAYLAIDVKAFETAFGMIF